MQADKSYTFNQQSKLSLGPKGTTSMDVHSQRKLLQLQEGNHFDHLLKRQEKLKKDLTFWNSMVDGRFETISNCTDLFILLLVITLGSTTYNGTGTNGPYVLGWICVAQVCFFYLVIVLIKFLYIPYIERELQQSTTQGFRIYNSVQSGKKQIKNLQLHQLQQIQEIITLRATQFRNSFPNAQPENILNQIKLIFGSRSNVPYQVNLQLQNLKFKEKNAIWWQHLWQIFILGKTFSIPGVLLLVFIITPLSNATQAVTSFAMNNAQGWLAVGFWAAGIVVFIIIKLFLWDYLNQNVQNAKSQPLITYHPISLKHKELKSLSLTQLEELQNVLVRRAGDFQACFPAQNANEVLNNVRTLLKQRLPKKKGDDEQLVLKQIIKKQKELQSLSAAWFNFFNQRLVVTIINSLKFLIVMAITFVGNYNLTTNNVQNAQIAVGSVGIGCIVFGYLFYIFLRAYYLDRLEEKAHQGRSSPFTTFKLVYFGNRNLKDLEVHELEDISDGLNLRRNEFNQCFASINPQTLHSEIQTIIKEKLAERKNTEQAVNLLKQQAHARKMLAFWTSYVDGPLMSSMYSVYVLLVLLIVSICSIYNNANTAMGWVGVGNLGLLIIIVLFFKAYFIQHLTNNTKALKVPGYSEFNLVYTKTKLLKNVQLSELQKIQTIIETNPIQFRRCFPKAGLQSTLGEVKQIITQKNQQKSNLFVRNAEQQVRYQTLVLELSRNKNLLDVWNHLILQRMYVYVPIAIVIYILWAQCIAATPYGQTVCGFLTVANLSIVAILVAFYNIFYRSYLERQIAQGENEVKILEYKQPIILNL